MLLPRLNGNMDHRNQTSLKFKAFTYALFLSFFLPLGVSQAATPEVFDLKVKADHLLKRGQVDQAVTLYESVLREDARFANAYYNLATAYYLQGKLKKAGKNLEAFVRLRPTDGEALYNLGCLRLRTGDFQEACRCFLRAGNCPCAGGVSEKIKEALRFTKDLQSQSPDSQKLIAYLLTA